MGINIVWLTLKLKYNLCVMTSELEKSNYLTNEARELK